MYATNELEERELTAAREIAIECWEHIRDYYGGEYEIHDKHDGPATDADKDADRFITAALRERFPEHGILSEESTDGPERLSKDRLWVVDPIDGTKDFIKGTGDFAIQIGLAAREGKHFQPRVGVVMQPIGERLYFAVADGGAWVHELKTDEERRMQVSKIDKLEEQTIVMTRSHRTKRFLILVERLQPAKTITMGSMGLKMAKVSLGEAEIYLNNARGYCKEWDICAPDIILREAGGTVTGMDGLPFTYNKEDVTIPNGVLATNGANHQQLVERILELETEVRRDFPD